MTRLTSGAAPWRRCATLAIAAALALLAVSTRATAQRPEWTPAPDEPGRARDDATPHLGGTSGLGAADREALLATADRVLAVLRGSALLRQPVGFDPVVWRAVGANGAAAAFGIPWWSGVEGKLWQRWHHRVGGVDSSESTGFVALAVLVNAPTCGVAANAHPEVDGGPPLLRTMQPTGSWRGHTVYDRTCVLLTRRDVPPVVPVSRERWLRLRVRALRALASRTAPDPGGSAEGPTSANAALASFLADRPKRERDRAQAVAAVRAHDPAAADRLEADGRRMEAAAEAQLRGAGNPASTPATVVTGRRAAAESLEARARVLEAQLASMSASERAAPAWVVARTPSDSVLAEPGAPGAVSWRQANPAFFDRALPPARPQCIAVRIDAGITEPAHRQDDVGAFRWLVAQHARDGIDWATLEAMLR